VDSPNFELDDQLSKLEREWQRVYESCLSARADYEAMITDERATADSLRMARARLGMAEARKEQVLAIIKRLEIRSLPHYRRNHKRA
jgi:hypothetical protein